MALTSRINIESNSIRNESSNFTLYEPQKHLTPTPHMTRMKFLQLHKLSDLSNCLRGKHHLIKIFFPNAKDILANESSQYAKDKLLEIITNICHVDKGIKIIGKDEELVKVIFCSFGNCARNVRLQKTLFKFLSLVMCEIQCNDESIWIRHLLNSYKYNFGPHILRLLTEYISDSGLFIEIMTFLHTLSDLTMPGGTNKYVLKHIFKIDDLVSALLVWFFTAFIPERNNFLQDEDKFWTVIDKWIRIMTVVAKLCFRSHPYDWDNDLDCTSFRFIVMHVHNIFMESLDVSEVFGRPVLHDNSLSLLSPPCLGAIYQSIRLLSSLPSCNLLLRNTESILDFLHLVSSFSEFKTRRNVQAVEEPLDRCEIGRKFQIIFSLAQQIYYFIYARREWSFKDILEIVLLWHYFYESFIISEHMLRSMFLIVPSNLQQKIDKLATYGIEIPYSLYKS